MHIGVYRTQYPIYSETFISEQVSNYSNDCSVICRDKLSDEERFSNAKSLISGYGSKLFFSLFGKVSKAQLQSLKGIDILHAHFGQDGFYAMKIAKTLNIPLVVTFHGQDCTVSDKDKIRSMQVSNINYVLFKKEIFEYASRVIAVSNFVKEQLIASGCPPNKIIVQYIGVDINRFSYRGTRPLTDNEPMKILSVGRHTEKKGLKYLLEAISICNLNIKLIQIGSGELTDDLKNLVISLNIQDKVTFLGAVSSDAVNQQMQSADLFVLPSVTAQNGDSEAFGIVFIEAAAVGIPVVSTLHGGIPEAVVAGHTGILVPECDSYELSIAITNLYHAPDKRAVFSVNSRKFVEENFDITLKTKELENLYKQILSE